MYSKLLLGLSIIAAHSLYAIQTDDRIIKPNSIVEYTKTPGEVSTFSDFLSEGKLYGRLRSNNFWYEYDVPDNGTALDHSKMGLGGNLTYKTPFYYGFAATVGFYGAIPVGSENLVGTTNYTKTAKDLYRTGSDGSENAIGVFAVGYGEYKNGSFDLMVGRQIIDTALLASNDAKMIPNTFEAALATSTYFPKTTLKLGYITAQKLRDHQEFHSIIAYEKLIENDDSSVHKGLSVSNLNSANKDVNPEMILVAAENKSLSNTRLYAEYGAISGYFSTLLLEGSYTFNLNDEWKLIPSIRYIRQFDDGAGAVGGASIAGSFGIDKTATSAQTATYSDIDSVDAAMVAGKLTLAKGAGQLALGYSQTDDKADIINPWRAFPSGGYTRAMAQNTWYANTDSWMAAWTYDFDKAKIIPGLYTYISYSHIDIDEAKSYAKTLESTDRDVIHIDAVQTLKSMPNTEFKFRFGAVDAKPFAYTGGVDPSYQEYRFEINYLF